MIIDVLYLNHNWNFWFFHSHQCKIEGNLINSFLVISTETTIVPPTLICFNYTSALNLRYPNTPISGKFGTGSNCSQNNRIRLSKSSINIHFYNFKERKIYYRNRFYEYCHLLCWPVAIPQMTETGDPPETRNWSELQMWFDISGP